MAGIEANNNLSLFECIENLHESFNLANEEALQCFVEVIENPPSTLLSYHEKMRDL